MYICINNFNNKDMKKNKETKKLKEGEEVIFFDGKTINGESNRRIYRQERWVCSTEQ